MMLALAAVAAFAYQNLSAVGKPGSERRLGAPDSQAVARSARRAQADFERARRQNLPLSFFGGSGRCDVRVGRYCYWHDDDEVKPPEEPPRIARLRQQLLARLAAAGAQVPGDGWIVGQRVRYLVEDGRAREAVDLARDCSADRWWCDALGGFALHALVDARGADSAYAQALAAMTAEERCRWTDITLLLDDPIAKRYDDLPCAARDSLTARFWALARPLYLREANDARIEHFARLTMARLEQVSRTAQETSWGDDMRELIIRYGWPTQWSRDPPSASDPLAVRVIGHDPSPSFDFAPSARAFASPAAADEGDWDFHDPEARTRYAPAYARTFVRLAHQIAFFRRGDSARVVAAFDLRRDPLFRSDSVAAAFALVPPSGDSAQLVRVALGERHQALTMRAPWSGAVASVEVFDSAAQRVARARRGVQPADALTGRRVGLSDLLLYEPGGEQPSRLDDALPRARGSLVVRAAEPVGVFWEMYGLTRPGEALAFSLTVVAEGEPWLRRAARSLGIGGRRSPVHMKWTEPVAHPDAVVPRALTVDLSRLPAGRYHMELALDVAGESTVRATRDLIVER